MIHDIVPREQLPSAIRLNASSRYLSILLGPAIGGGLMLLLGPAWGLLVNALIYLPFTIFLLRVPYTGHASAGGPRREPLRFSDVAIAYAAARSERRIVTMIVLAGASSFFVGNAFQAQMPEYAQYLGADEAGGRYSVLLAANAGGAVIGVVLLESTALLQVSVRNALICAALWAIAMGLFPLTASYPAAVALLVIAGIFSIAFTSMAQTIVQLLAPAQLRGRLVGLFNTAMLGLRAGAGLTVGIAGAFIGVRLSLALSALAVLVITVVLFARDSRPAIS
jgi:sugar phosphate permease